MAGFCGRESITSRHLPYDQNFPHVVPREKELDRSKIAEEIFDVTVVEYALQLETIRDRAVHCPGGSAPCFPAKHDRLHFQCILANDMEAVAGRVGARIAGMEESQQHAARLQDRPQPSNDRPDQAFIEIVGQVPAEDHVEVGGGIDQVVGKKLPAVEHNGALLILGDEMGLGGGSQQIFAVNLMPALGKVADVDGRRGTEIENTQSFLAVPGARQFAQPA